MTAVAVVAWGALSPLGSGERAVSVGAAHEHPRSVVRDDPELLAAGLRKARAARVPAHLLRVGARRPEALLEAAARALVEDLERSVPAWRGLRLALCVGTSAGGVWSLERALSLRAQGREIPPELARGALYGGPLEALAPWFAAAAPRVSVLGACVASTFALGLATRWLAAGHADLVIAGGYDALSVFVATGFEALGATTSGEPAPFRAARDGMALGEGAALLALMRAEEAPSVRAAVLGFGATSDAVHVTAPDPAGAGLARAAVLALGEAGTAPDAIDFVSAHATATLHNDAAEGAALASVFAAARAQPAVHPFKGVVGHTLGAAGALETLAAVSAMRVGLIPGAAGAGPLDPAFSGRLLETNVPGRARRCLKLSAAFGGANAALVLATDVPSTSQGGASLRAVTLLHEGEPVRASDPELLARTRLDELRRSRLDRASALAVTAAASALEALPRLDPMTTAVVVGTFAASLEANELFDARRRDRGVSSVEPRRFPATSPNLPAGWCTLAFGLHGPSIAVGGGPDAFTQALVVGHDLVAAGDAEHALVIVCDDVGPVTLDLCRAAGLEPPSDGARAVVLGTDPLRPRFQRPTLGHR